MFSHRSLANYTRLFDLLVGSTHRQCAHSSAFHLPKHFVGRSIRELEKFGFVSRAETYLFSLESPEQFWALCAKRLDWIKKFNTVTRGDFNDAKVEWFPDGQLNVAANCVDRHALLTPDKVALIWEKDEPGTEVRVSYSELSVMVNQIANLFKSHGITVGDPVTIYMPVSPMAVATMLACARIGAIHCVVFAGFSADALAARINDANSRTVVTCDQAVRGGRTIDLKATVDAAVRKCPQIERVFVAARTGASVAVGAFDIPLEQEMAKQSVVSEPVPMGGEDPLFMLYTSGSTGRPKGLLHTQAGYLLHAALTHQLVFQWKPGDIFGCVADIGWITGHSYVVYGPLANGATTVLFESVPTYPDYGRYWEMVERLRINQFYCAPTALRILHAQGDAFVQKYDRSSLRVLGSVGEPINHEAWHWYHSVVGEKRCAVVDTWWQTETGGICIAPLPADDGSEIIPAIAMRPFFGIKLALMNEQGKEIPKSNMSVDGALCIKYPWPGMARSIYKDHDRFRSTYFSTYPGYYFTGDGATRSTAGHYQITGRMDDVINVSGHRLGTAEVEDELDEVEGIAESAVVGIPHQLKGEGIFAFITLMPGEEHRKDDDEFIAVLRKHIASRIAKYAVPDNFLFTPSLPKTRSGKIMRRILRKIAMHDYTDLGDISTLSDPSVVQAIINEHKKLY